MYVKLLRCLWSVLWTVPMVDLRLRPRRDVVECFLKVKAISSPSLACRVRQDGKGLHVSTPIRASVAWDAAKSFTRAIAELMARTFPKPSLATMTKSRRQGKIFIDYLRNAEGSTAIAPYGLRACAGTPCNADRMA